MGYRIRHKGYMAEVKALEKYSRKYKYVYRVPMSLLPFDIIAVDDDKREILFIEVKTRGGCLTERQKNFKRIIGKHSEWKVRYVVEVIDL